VDGLCKILFFFQFDPQTFFPSDLVLIEDQLILISYVMGELKEE